MLSCLIVLPAIAIFGLPMPNQMTAFLTRLGLFGAEDTKIAAAPAESPRVLETPTEGDTSLCDRTSPSHLGGNRPSAAGFAFDPMVVPVSNEVPVAAAESAQKGVGPFRGIQQRLRFLGATYYRLESWGERGELFHFQCRVAVDGHVNFTRHFEATGEDPLAAMDSVLNEIESWKDRRGPVETSATTP